MGSNLDTDIRRIVTDFTNLEQNLSGQQINHF